MQVRAARAADIEAIRSIYNAEIAFSTVTLEMVPWTHADALAWLDAHRGAHAAVVAVAGPDDGIEPGAIAGFGSLSAFRPRPAYSGSVENSVYVHRDHRQAGVGRLLLEALVTLARTHGFHTVIARVVAGNDASIALHRACGFELVGVEREVGRKHRQWLDIVELQLML
jgi:L-amino acid N-acyltransferase